MTALVESFFQKLLQFSRAPQKAACIYLDCLNKYILERYRKNLCVYESRLYKEDFLLGIENTTVESILKSDGHSVQKNQILCISAEPGYGKDFLAKRICALDYDYTYPSEQTDFAGFNPFLAQGCGRMPFIIQKVDIEHYFNRRESGADTVSNSLCWICAASMMRVLDTFAAAERWKCSYRDELFKLILKSLREPLENGKLFVLFEKDAMLAHSKALETILCADLPAEKAQAVPKNMLVFVLDSVTQNPLRWAPYQVVLTRLTKEEVLNYVRFCSEDSNIVQEFETLFATIPACTIPDCLLFMTETHIGQGGDKVTKENIPKVETAADLYRDCIRKAVQARFPSHEVEKVLRQLQRYAWSTYGGQPSFCIPEEVAERLMYEQGERNHLLKKDKVFRFEGCREYLIAEMLYEKLLGDPEEKWDGELLKNANGNIKARLLEIAIQQYKNNHKEGGNRDLQSERVLQRFWETLLSEGTVLSYPEMEFLTSFLTTLDTAGGPIDMEKYGNDYLKQVTLQMEERIYDNRLFQLFSEANRKTRSYKINRQLKEQYLQNVMSQYGAQDEAEKRRKDRFNRRYLFYVGQHSQVDSKIISGVYNENLSDHMKCHLMRAMRDNCFDKKSKNDIRPQIDDMVSYSAKSENQILRLNILILQQLLMDVPLDSKCFQKPLLLEQLDDNEYWIRAHSADVIAYIIDDISIPEKLAEALAREVAREEEGYIRLKVINHMAEAICEFYFFRAWQKLPCSDNVKDYQSNAIQRMLWLINPEDLESGETGLTAMSMYATIAESVIYLLEGNYSARPTFIGVHVSDGKEQWDQNAALVVEALRSAVTHYGVQGIEVILRNFQDALDNIMRDELAVAQNKWPSAQEDQEVTRNLEDDIDSSNNAKGGTQMIFNGPVGGVTGSGPVTVIQNNSKPKMTEEEEFR